MKFVFETYHDERGNDIIERELNRLDKSDHARVLSKLRNISMHGTTPKNYTRFKGYALNVEYGEFIVGDFRVLNMFYNGTFILLHLFRKQSNITPAREKEIGWERAIDYLSKQKP